MHVRLWLVKCILSRSCCTTRRSFWTMVTSGSLRSPPTSSPSSSTANYTKPLSLLFLVCFLLCWIVVKTVTYDTWDTVNTRIPTDTHLVLTHFLIVDLMSLREGSKKPKHTLRALSLDGNVIVSHDSSLAYSKKKKKSTAISFYEDLFENEHS